MLKKRKKNGQERRKHETDFRVEKWVGHLFFPYYSFLILKKRAFARNLHFEFHILLQSLFGYSCASMSPSHQENWAFFTDCWRYCRTEKFFSRDLGYQRKDLPREWLAIDDQILSTRTFTSYSLFQKIYLFFLRF